MGGAAYCQHGDSMRSRTSIIAFGGLYPIHWTMEPKKRRADQAQLPGESLWQSWPARTTAGHLQNHCCRQWYLHQGSNLDPRFRRPILCPLSYRGISVSFYHIFGELILADAFEEQAVSLSVRKELTVFVLVLESHGNES